MTALTCVQCEKPFTAAARGPVPKYCGQACRQRAYEGRKVEKLERDLAIAVGLLERYQAAAARRSYLMETSHSAVMARDLIARRRCASSTCENHPGAGEQ